MTFCIGLAREKRKNEETREIDQNRIVRFRVAARGRGYCANSRRVSAGREYSEEYEAVLFVSAGEGGEVDAGAVCGSGDAGAHGVHSRAGGSGEVRGGGAVLDEGRIGGMAIINAASIEEAKKIVNGDKMIQSGRLIAEIHPVMLADLSGLHTEYPSKVGK
jgi:hypothetical protein